MQLYFYRGLDKQPLIQCRLGSLNYALYLCGFLWYCFLNKNFGPSYETHWNKCYEPLLVVLYLPLFPVDGTDSKTKFWSNVNALFGYH